MHWVSTMKSTTMMRPPMPPPAFIPPGIGMAPPPPPRPPPPRRPRPASRIRLVSSRALGLKRMQGTSGFRGWRHAAPRLASLMITAHQLEVRAGARLLMENVSFRVAAGDKVGLVGRNGAGKTTLTKILAREALPAAGSVQSNGEVGYLPQDPRIGDPEVLARDRILSARGLDDVVRRLRAAEVEMGSDDDEIRERAMKRWSRADAE